jgi:tRNA dimethylallyltransferase
MPPIPAAIRQTLQSEALSHGLAALYQELTAVDPVLAARLHANDQQRIIRGLEIYRTTGQQLSVLQKASKKQVIIDR